MDCSEIRAAVLSFIRLSCEWPEEPETKILSHVDNDLWKEAVLWADSPTPIREILQEMHERVDRTGDVRRTGKNLSYVNSGGNYASCLGELLASQLDIKNSEAAELFERVIIKWICYELGLSPKADGCLTSGGTPSTVISVAAAREAMGIQISDSENLMIYLTPLTHVCIDKALMVAGLRRSKLKEVRLDEACGMDVRDLEKQITNDTQAGLRPFMIVASYGTVSVGSIDPLQKIAKIAAKYKVWLHVDGAFGGFLHLRGDVKISAYFHLADSIILDSHKTLFQPFGSSVVLFKNGRHKLLGDESETSTWSNPLENKITPRGFPLWFSLNALGVETFRKAIRKDFELANYAADYLRRCPDVIVQPLFTVIVAFRIGGQTKADSNAKTNRWFSLLEDDCRVVLSKTTEEGFVYIRIACCNFRAYFSEIEFCLKILTEKLEEVLGVQKMKLPFEKPAAAVPWLKEFEVDTKALEQELNLKETPNVLENLYKTSFILEQRLGNGKPVKSVETLWPSETPRSVDTLLQAVNDLRNKEVSKKQRSYAGALGQFLASLLNVYSAKRMFNPGAVDLEQRLIGHLASKFAMSEKSRGVLSSDCGTANILALLAARDDKLTENAAAPRPVVYTSKEGRQHFLKPLHLLGMSSSVFHVVESNSNGALDPDDFMRTLNRDRMNPNVRPWLVAENLCSGHDSELQKVPKVVHFLAECNVWHHVQISGLDQQQLWSNTRWKTLKDLSRADSISVEIGADLCQSVGIAAVVVSEPIKLRHALTFTREMRYDPVPEDEDLYGPFLYSFELSRPCRALPLWFTISFLGTDNLK